MGSNVSPIESLEVTSRDLQTQAATAVAGFPAPAHRFPIPKMTKNSGVLGRVGKPWKFKADEVDRWVKSGQAQEINRKAK